MLLGANLIQLVLIISLAATAESSSMVVRTLLYGASITMLMLMIPFVNSLGMETIRQERNLITESGAAWVPLHMRLHHGCSAG